MPTSFNIEEVFTYHKPITNQPERYESLRNTAKEFAKLIEISCPESREKSIAFTKLQEAVMFANAAIAINEK